LIVTLRVKEKAGSTSGSSARPPSLAALGPGPISIDRLVGLDTTWSPWVRAALAAGLGIGGAAAQLATFWQRPLKQEAAAPVADA
jgi:hypothetical protein